MENLYDNVELIKKWCNDNDLSCFVGHADDEPMMSYTYYSKSTKNDWIDFLKIAKHVGIKLIILEQDWNFIKDLNERDAREIINKEENDSIKKSFLNVLDHNNELAQIKLSFYDKEIQFIYLMNSAWYSDFNNFRNKLEDLDEDKEFESKESELRLTDSEIDTYARKVIADEEYLKANKPLQRGEIARRIIKNILSDDLLNNPNLMWLIKNRADLLFENEIKPKQEGDIRKKIKDLKSQGLKKIQIMSKLGISQRMIDKFFYLDD